MRHLVLHHAAGELVELLGHFLSVLVVVLHRNRSRSAHLAINSRNAQAALRIIDLLLALLQDHRIQHRALEILQVIVNVRHAGAVHDQCPLAHAYLRRCKSASVRMFQCVFKILYKRGDSFLVRQIHVFSLGPENFGTI